MRAPETTSDVTNRPPRRAPLVSEAAQRRLVDELQGALGGETRQQRRDPRPVPLFDEPAIRPRAAVTGLSPLPCPRCREPGLLDRIDLAAGEQSLHCRACRRYWTAPLHAAT